MDSFSKIAEHRAKKKKKKSESELAKEVDIYGNNDLAWYDEDLEDKKRLRRKYRPLYDRMKDKQP